MFRNIIVFAIPIVVGGVRKADKPVVSASHYVAEQLSSFIQENSRAAAKPELARAVELLQSTDGSYVSGSNLTEALDEVIDTIDETIIEDIYAHHNDTQTLITSRYTAAVTATDNANTKYDDAKHAFSTLHDCMTNEKTDLETFETEKLLTGESQNRHDEAQQQAQDAAAISGTMDSITFSCDASQDINCTIQTQEFDNKTDEALNTFNSSIQTAIQNFTQKNVSWGHSITNLSAQRGNEDSAWDDFTEKVGICNTATENLTTEVCEWTSAEEDAEAAVLAYNHLKSEVEGTGNLHSEDDRAAEYVTAKKVVCLLHRLKSDSDAPCPEYFYGYSRKNETNHADTLYPGFVPLDFKDATQMSWRTDGDFITEKLGRDWTNMGTQVSPTQSTEYSMQSVKTSRTELDAAFECNSA